MSLKGGCCCGAVRYETTERVFNKTICHCPTCRRTGGAASVAWLSVALGEYKVTAGTPAQFRASAGVTRSFCGACGTPLTYWNSSAPDVIDVTICSLDQPEAAPPDDHTFTAYRLSWDRSADGKREYAQLRGQG